MAPNPLILIGLILFLVFVLSSYNSIGVIISVCGHIGYNSAASYHGSVSLLMNPPYLTPNHEINYNFYETFTTNTLPQIKSIKQRKYTMHTSGTNSDFLFIFIEPTPHFFLPGKMCVWTRL